MTEHVKHIQWRREDLEEQLRKINDHLGQCCDEFCPMEDRKDEILWLLGEEN